MTKNIDITISGRIGTTPILAKSGAGRPYTQFRVGYSRSHRNEAGSWEDLQTEWFTVKAWGTLAENLCYSLAKGDPVIISGRFVSEEWVQDDQRRSNNCIYAQAVGPDLNFGRTMMVKVPRPAPENPTASEAVSEETENPLTEVLTAPVPADLANLENADYQLIKELVEA